MTRHWFIIWYTLFWTFSLYANLPPKFLNAFRVIITFDLVSFVQGNRVPNNVTHLFIFINMQNSYYMSWPWLAVMCEMHGPRASGHHKARRRGFVATGSHRFYASLTTRMFPLPWINTVCFSTFWLLCHCRWFKVLLCTHRLFHWSSFLSLPTIATTLVCTYTTSVNASWQSAGWPWLPVVPLFSIKYCGHSISKSS